MFGGGQDMTMKPSPWSTGDRRYQAGAEMENEAVAALLDKWAAAELADDRGGTPTAVSAASGHP